MTKSDKFKILGKYIKDLSSETPNVETYLFVRDYISSYQLGIDITSKALKDKLIEIGYIIKNIYSVKGFNKVNVDVSTEKFSSDRVNIIFNIRVMQKPNKKRNPVARQLRHFKKKVIKNKKRYDRKKFQNTY